MKKFFADFLASSHDRARLSRERKIYWLPTNNRKICRVISIRDRVSNATSAVHQAFPTVPFTIWTACCPHHLINDRSRSPMHSTRFSSRKSPMLQADHRYSTRKQFNHFCLSLEMIINDVTRDVLIDCYSLICVWHYDDIFHKIIILLHHRNRKMLASSAWHICVQFYSVFSMYIGISHYSQNENRTLGNQFL